jgi:hypothetical protein
MKRIVGVSLLALVTCFACAEMDDSVDDVQRTESRLIQVEGGDAVVATITYDHTISAVEAEHLLDLVIVTTNPSANDIGVVDEGDVVDQQIPAADEHWGANPPHDHGFSVDVRPQLPIDDARLDYILDHKLWQFVDLTAPGRHCP